MKNLIEQGDVYIGIEFGSTRIKAVMTDADGSVLANGGKNWENMLENGMWIYTPDQIHSGLKDCYADLLADVKAKYNTVIKKVKVFGISGMMHGYIALDKDKNILAPFRTWRNNITAKESALLTELFDFNIPQRWSIAHLCQTVQNKESYLKDVDYLTTLAGYIHYLLTGEKVMGICEASGMFPIDPKTYEFNREMIEKFNGIMKKNDCPLLLENILPRVLCAGESAGTLTKEGAAFMDASENLEPGAAFCPPEGDAGTGMVATNSIRKKTGNISAGTSAFAMVVLENELSRVYEEFDIVHTPDGSACAMVHSNNCTTEINSWVALFSELLREFGTNVSTSKLYETLFKKANQGDRDCGGLMAYCFHSGEHLLGLSKGCPMFLHNPEAKFNLANFMRAQIYTSFGVLKSGLDLLKNNENVVLDKITGHGGIFKTECVAQNILASAINTPVAVNAAAGEGGAWGIAVLAAYLEKANEITLDDFLDNVIFKDAEITISSPNAEVAKGYEEFMKSYNRYLKSEYAAI